MWRAISRSICVCRQYLVPVRMLWQADWMTANTHTLTHARTHGVHVAVWQPCKLLYTCYFTYLHTRMHTQAGWVAGNYSINLCVLTIPRARAYATASGLRRCFKSLTMQRRASLSLRGTATAAPAGLTCLNDVAAGRPSTCFNSDTNCQPLSASSRLM